MDLTTRVKGIKLKPLFRHLVTIFLPQLILQVLQTFLPQKFANRLNTSFAGAKVVLSREFFGKEKQANKTE